MSDAPIIDQATFDALLESVGGDESFLVELIDTFLDDSPQLFATMRQALGDGNAEAFRRAAHSLKSNGANFGALTLSTLAKELELLGKNNALADAPTTLALAEVEYDKVKEALLQQRSAMG
jgi:HPt (histidine-containing phosphotransfer) domain-containing protein